MTWSLFFSRRRSSSGSSHPCSFSVLEIVGMNEGEELLFDDGLAVARDHRAEREVRVEDRAVEVGQNYADGRMTEDLFEGLLVDVEGCRQMDLHWRKVTHYLLSQHRAA